MARFNPKTRRHFLQALGGATLSLPFLPSLWPSELEAAPVGPNARCFAAFQIGHGGYWAEDLVGSILAPIDSPPASLKEELWLRGGTDSATGQTFPDHFIRHGDLTDYLQTAQAAGDSQDPDMGAQRLSYALGSRANALLPKMSILRGICLPVKSFGHQSSVTLGQFGRSQNGPDYPSAASIDAIMSESSAFYPNLDGVSRRAIRFGGMSTDLMGRPIEDFHANDTRTVGFFNAVFNGQQSDEQVAQDTLLVDQVLADYQRFTSATSYSGQRISAADRATLDQTMQHLFEVQRRSQVTVSCGDPEAPPDIWRYPDYNPEYFTHMTDMIALAFACGATRVGTFGFGGRWFPTGYSGDYHQEVAHQLGNRENGIRHRQQLRLFYDRFILPLTEKLDSYPGSQPGSTKLDDCLLAVTPESGFDTHRFKDDTIVTIGGAAGCLQTGKYIDYRNLRSRAYGGEARSRRPLPGALRNTLLSTCLEAMGIPRSEWQHETYFGTKAYGGFLVDSTSRSSGEVSHSQNPGAHADQIHLPVWWRG